MWNVPSKERLDRIPGLYETEHVSLKEKQIHLHFFISGSDWYVTEFDGDLFFGFVILNNDLFNSEWGYFSFGELKDLRISGIEIDCELEAFWRVRPAIDVEPIRKAMRWQHDVEQANQSRQGRAIWPTHLN